MGETELLGMIRDVNAQYAVLFGQVISINFAMIVAIYYFLHRSPLLFRVAAFGFYAIGMLALFGMMLIQSNYKFQALAKLAALPPGKRSPIADSIVAIHQSWLGQASSFFLTASIVLLFVVIAYLLFWWGGDPERRVR